MHTAQRTYTATLSMDSVPLAPHLSGPHTHTSSPPFIMPPAALSHPPTPTHPQHTPAQAHTAAAPTQLPSACTQSRHSLACQIFAHTFSPSYYAARCTHPHPPSTHTHTQHSAHTQSTHHHVAPLHAYTTTSPSPRAASQLFTSLFRFLCSLSH